VTKRITSTSTRINFPLRYKLPGVAGVGSCEDRQINLTLVPFGLDVSTLDLVDVCDVSGGKACGCVCPSCGGQLIARHGSINQWHFAHASKGITGAINEPCEYSFFVSVRLMARQLVHQTLSIMLPGFRSQVCHIDEITGETSAIDFTVTELTEVTLLNVETESRVGDVVVDLIGRVGDYSLAICFTHPGRDFPLRDQITLGGKCGLIKVSLDSFYKNLASVKLQKESYGAALRRFLEKDVLSKMWLHHPRDLRKKQQAEIELSNRLSAVRSERLAETSFSCGVCGHTWVGPASKSKCPKCNSHLYSYRNENT